MKCTRWIALIIIAAGFVSSSMFAWSQTFYTSAQNSGKNEYFSITVPASCDISSVAGFTGTGSGGGGAGVHFGGVTIYSVGYSGSTAGSSSRSVSGQPAGTYQINQYATAIGGATGFASTTVTW